MCLYGQYVLIKSKKRNTLIKLKDYSSFFGIPKHTHCIAMSWSYKMKLYERISLFGSFFQLNRKPLLNEFINI